jgi:hypothetical protein
MQQTDVLPLCDVSATYVRMYVPVSWLDSNPRTADPEADAMASVPRNYVEVRF